MEPQQSRRTSEMEEIIQAVTDRVLAALQAKK
jgi:hypothetical protein